MYFNGEFMDNALQSLFWRYHCDKRNCTLFILPSLIIVFVLPVVGSFHTFCYRLIHNTSAVRLMTLFMGRFCVGADQSGHGALRGWPWWPSRSSADPGDAGVRVSCWGQSEPQWRGKHAEHRQTAPDDDAGKVKWRGSQNWFENRQTAPGERALDW